jgi:hypothetical protein
MPPLYRLYGEWRYSYPVLYLAIPSPSTLAGCSRLLPLRRLPNYILKLAAIERPDPCGQGKASFPNTGGTDFCFLSETDSHRCILIKDINRSTTELPATYRDVLSLLFQPF